MNFSNFLLWKVYLSMVIHHEQYIFVTNVMDQPVGKETIFNNLSKLIELNFISTT